MCGIFGVIHKEDTVRTSYSDIERALDSLKHRGPDSWGIKGIQVGSHIKGYLAHNRLSIIDLDGGKQPMEDKNAGLILSYNGEIYNYKQLREELIKDGFCFREKSDTEVVLRAYQRWGKDCVKHFRGMFAFAVWDAINEELFVARDHFGEKPLFYVQKNSSLYISSEIKALLSIPTLSFSLDYSVIQNYLVYRYVPGPDTLIREIKKLPPGSKLVWKKGVANVSSYFTPPDADADPKLQKFDNKNVVSDFWDTLDEAVRLRMQSDVPFGAFLSGGIDSSALVALMSRHTQQKVKTFSVGFEESEYSELKYARDVSTYFSTDHHELIVSHEDLIGLLPEVVRHRDAPVSEPSDIAIYLLAKEAKKTVKMVLTGEGSDEVLGGYPKHLYERFAHPYRMIPKVVRHRLIEPIVYSLPYKYRRAKTAIRSLGIDDYNERMPSWFGAMNLSQAQKILNLREQRWLPSLSRSASGSALRNILLFDQESWLPDNLLERGDRMTMAASIEARMPFMDTEVAAFAASLPDNCRIRGSDTKWILREAVKNVLPKNILERPKVGFRIPVNEWFKNGMRSQLVDSILGSSSLSMHLYNANVLRKVVNEHLDGKQNHEKLLWTILNLEIWMKEYTGRVSM